MYLSRLRLWNFRKYGSGADEIDLEHPHLDVPFTQGVNVLIGENDSGKTAIIDAIKIVLDTHSGEWNRLLSEDFHVGTSRLRIECRFEDLADEEAAHFIEWLGMDGDGEQAKPYLKVILDANKRNDNERLHYDIRAGADDEGHRLEAEARDYLRTTYLKPLRDAKSELVPRRNSRLSQILTGLAAFKGKKEHELNNVSRCFDCLLRKYFDPEYKDETCADLDCPHARHFYTEQEQEAEEGKNRVAEGQAIRLALQTMLNHFFGHADYRASFGVMGRELRNILEQFRLLLVEEELGLGSQNLLFIAAELLNLRREPWTGLRLALIEELEAHLDPQAQVRVIEYLQTEADGKHTTSDKSENGEAKAEKSAEDHEKNEDTGDKGFQVILTTHSPNLGSKVKLNNLIVCQGAQVFPMGPEYTRLKGPDYAFLERFLDVTKANLFFAKGVILVEGPSEELILSVLARKAGYDLTRAGVSIVCVDNLAFLRYAKIFQRKRGKEMGIPVAVVRDLDIKPDEYKATDGDAKTEEGSDLPAENKAIRDKYEGQSVKAFVSPHWTLEYCLARSKALAPHLYEATKQAIEEMREDGYSRTKVSEKYDDFSKGKNQEQIAFNLYHEIILKKNQKVSKPIVAQHLAALLDKANIAEADLVDKDSTGYLIDAIKYVTSNNNNQ